MSPRRELTVCHLVFLTLAAMLDPKPIDKLARIGQLQAFAEHLDISIGTVSRALNDSPLVKEETKEQTRH